MSTSSAIPLACDLTALTAEERARHAQLWSHLHATAPIPVPTAHGFAFHCPPGRERAMDLAELAALEGRRCPFLDIRLHFAPAGGPLTLELTGDESVRAFLTDTLMTGGGPTP